MPHQLIKFVLGMIYNVPKGSIMSKMSSVYIVFIGFYWRKNERIFTYSKRYHLCLPLTFVQKYFDEDVIRTHACTAHWISNPTP